MKWVPLAIFLVFLPIVVFFPTILMKIVDPRNMKIIRAYFEQLGFSDIEIKIYPNHYGVRFGDKKPRSYVRCLVKKGKVEWTGPVPVELSQKERELQ